MSIFRKLLPFSFFLSRFKTPLLLFFQRYNLEGYTALLHGLSHVLGQMSNSRLTLEETILYSLQKVLLGKNWDLRIGIPQLNFYNLSHRSQILCVKALLGILKSSSFSVCSSESLCDSVSPFVKQICDLKTGLFKETTLQRKFCPYFLNSADAGWLKYIH